jgi:phenylpropionate dioxygenase-like ring-hydroxylating dioxygenase large terminal subunit
MGARQLGGALHAEQKIVTTPWPCAIAQGWHPVAYQHELSSKPLAVTLLCTPLVLFRHSGGISALLDRCPHRNVPLSLGRVAGGTIACTYHGWRFAPDGQCVEVPGAAQCAKAQVQAFATQELHGLIWVCLANTPRAFPRLWPQLLDTSLDSFWWPLPAARANLLDALENHLDPAHPHYLHPWLVRKPNQRRPVQVDLTTHTSGAQARYTEQTAMLGWLPRLFERERRASVGELFGCTIGQVRFEDQQGPTIAISVVFSPLDHGLTRPFAHFASRKGLLPAWLKQQLIIAFHRPVLAQDKKMLAIQTDAIERFGSPQYRSHSLDLMGPTIWALANDQAITPSQQTLELLL